MNVSHTAPGVTAAMAILWAMRETVSVAGVPVLGRHRRGGGGRSRRGCPRPITDRRPHRRALLALFVGLALAAACSSPSGASRPASGQALLAQAAPPSHAGPLAPIASLVTATAITSNGSPVGASTDFAATVPDIVAVVEVGYLSGARQALTVTWSKVPSAGTAQVLFSQRLSVASGDVAYAAAVNPGRLFLGLYRVEASLAGMQASAWFEVDDPYGPLGVPTPAPVQGRSKVATASYVAEGAPPTTETGVTAAGMGSAAAPTAGPTGTVAPPSPSGGTGCELAIAGDASATAFVEMSGCSGDEVALSATVNGQTQLVQTAHAADATIPVRVDPCSVDPSLGYGATKVTYSATVTSGPDKGKSAVLSGTQTVEPPTGAPYLILDDNTPDVGSQVSGGDEILLTFEAHSPAGIRSVTVTADPGGTLKSETYDQHPTRCTTIGTDQVVVVPPYTVPADAPPLITITAVATDFAGRSETLVLTYPTEAVWLGTALGDGGSNYGSEPNGVTSAGLCKAHWLIQFQVNVPANKAISGAAQASTSLVPCTVVGPFYLPPSFPGGVDTFKVTGSYDGSVFKLLFDPAQTNEAFTTGGLYLLVTHGVSLGGRTMLVLARTSSTRADGDLDLSTGRLGVLDVPVGTLKLAASLYCCYPDAGPTKLATKTPPIFIH